MNTARLLLSLLLLAGPLLPAAAADAPPAPGARPPAAHALTADAAIAVPLPLDAGEKFLGNATCANDACHGRGARWQVSAVLQDEFARWRDHDPHARAYRALGSERARRIGAALGIDDPQQSAQCLGCHAGNVAPERRGRRHELADGVGCESCHGGSDRWLGVHVSSTGGHAENLAAGLFPASDPLARARLCASCHVGDAQRPVTHRLYGAGHPRLAFELDSYTAAGARHYRVTDAYVKRKGRPDHAQAWAIGQAQAAMLRLEGIADPARFRRGTSPEPAYFDCDACHHRMDRRVAVARPEQGGRIGQPRLDDTALLLLEQVAAQLSHARGERLRAQRLALHAALAGDMAAVREAALALHGEARALATELHDRHFRAPELRALALALSGEPVQRALHDYALAEQLTLAHASLLAALADAGADTAAPAAALDALYAPADAPQGSFDAAAFRAALARLHAALAALPLPATEP